jgi:hypothetical protein
MELVNKNFYTLLVAPSVIHENETACFKKCEQLFEYQQVTLLRDTRALYYKPFTAVIIAVS